MLCSSLVERAARGFDASTWDFVYISLCPEGLGRPRSVDHDFIHVSCILDANMSGRILNVVSFKEIEEWYW